jgi:hypothetical protein
MAERRRRPELPPRWLTIGEAAQYLGHSPSWLTAERLARLQETGFPRIDPVLDRIDREGIDEWSDRRSRFVHEPLVAAASDSGAISSEEEDPWAAAARGMRDGKGRGRAS